MQIHNQFYIWSSIVNILALLNFYKLTFFKITVSCVNLRMDPQSECGSGSINSLKTDPLLSQIRDPTWYITFFAESCIKGMMRRGQGVLSPGQRILVVARRRKTRPAPPPPPMTSLTPPPIDFPPMSSISPSEDRKSGNKFLKSAALVAVKLFCGSATIFSWSGSVSYF